MTRKLLLLAAMTSAMSVLTCMSGCKPVPVETPETHVILRANIHVRSQEDIDFAQDQVLFTNMFLKDYVYLVATYDVNPKLPAEYKEWNARMASNTYDYYAAPAVEIHMTERVFEDGEEVAGLYVPVYVYNLINEVHTGLCGNYIVVATDTAQPNILAHEIGHHLGLYHETDRTNVMHESAYSGSFEPWQLESAREHADFYNWRCGQR